MKVKHIFSDLDYFISSNANTKENRKSINENLKDDDNNIQFEFFPELNDSCIDEAKNFEAICDINSDFCEQLNKSHNTVHINSKNYSIFNGSMNSVCSKEDFNAKKNLTSQDLDLSYVIKYPQIYNTPNQKEKKTKNAFLCKKRLFNIYPKDFIIFNEGGKDIQTRQFIEKVINSNKSKGINNTRKDNLMIKIKRSFIKALKGTVNEKLRMGGSQKFFTYLPYKFTSSLNKKINREALDLTFKEVFSKNFSNEDDENSKDANFTKYNENLSVINYLEKRDTICKKSNYQSFKNMKLYQIFNEYLKSEEFEQKIFNLKEKKKKDNIYIVSYIELAYNLIDYFCNEL